MIKANETNKTAKTAFIKMEYNFPLL